MDKGYAARYGFDNIISESDIMEDKKELAARVAKISSTVLILGESGTGKELFAHAIHRLSPRRDKPFVRVNCSAIPDELFESELFGYEKGAFSGARKEGKPGKFELANGGSLFLDEVAELPYTMQGKLLRVLQEREIERIGGTELDFIDVRIIVASNRPLKPLIAQKQFRKDLYYRLHVFPIDIPPLRERKEDILALADFFLKQSARAFSKPPLTLANEAQNWLLAQRWEGNARELQNLIEAAVLLTDGTTLSLSSLLLLAEDENDNGNETNVTLNEALEKTERKCIEQALSACRGDRKKAAEQLGIHYTSLYRKMAKHHLDASK